MGRPLGSKNRQRRQGRVTVSPWLRCTATSKQTGKQCGNPAAFGAFVCSDHGAKAPQVLEGARQRVEALVPLAVQRLADMLHSQSDAVVLAAARDLLDRIGARTPAQLELSGSVEVTTPNAEVLAATLAGLRAAPARLEQEIIDALARQHGITETDPARRLQAVHEAVVTGHLAEALPMRPGRLDGGDGADRDEVVDAVIVVPQPAALPPAPEPEDESIVVGNGRYPASGLSPGGGRRSR